MRIQVTPEACSGYRLCPQVCAIGGFGDTNPRRARLRIEAKFPSPGRYLPQVCDQCGDCAEACPENAITQNDRGAYVVDAETCTLCGVCIEVCTSGVMMKGDDDLPYKCDFCWSCTEVCNTGALLRVE